MKILAFLQNQWFRDPEGIKEIFAAHPERRERYIAAYLFMGCLTGRRLKSAFGEELCDRIVWEEISSEIGGHASSKFPPDPEHIERVIRKHEPDVIICFGKLASDGLSTMIARLGTLPIKGFSVLYGPHPAARQNPMPALRAIANRLKRRQ